MKVIAILFVSLLATSTVAAADCVVANSASLSWINTNAPTLLTSALEATEQTSTNPWTVCKNVWTAQGGTCCKTEALKTFFETKAQGHKGSWGKLLSGVVKFKGGLEKIKKLLAADATKLAAAIAKIVADNPADLPQFTAESLKAKLTDVANNFEAKLKAFKDSGKACFKALHPYRGAGFCYMCSGNSATFFGSSAPMKLKISGPSCNEAVKSCITSWGFMGEIQEAAFIMGAFAKAKGGAPAGTPPKPSEALFAGSVNDLKTGLDHCKGTAGALSGACTQEDLNNICLAFVNIVQAEKVAKDQGEIDNGDPARLLQVAGEGALAIDGSGADLSLGAAAGLTSTAEVDTSTAGDSSSMSKILISVFGTLLLLVALLN